MRWAACRPSWYRPRTRCWPAASRAARRRYLDVLLAVTSPGYLAALQAYRTSLLRRNAAIRELARRGRGDEGTVAVWEPALACMAACWAPSVVSGSGETTARFRELAPPSASETRRIPLRGERSEAADPATALAARLEHGGASDIRRGATNTGPHRDTLVMTLEGRELRSVGSAGQQRTAAVALRLLEAETYQRRTGSAPVFLMDDPFAELDARRGAAIVAVLQDAAIGQTFLAVPKASDIPDGFTKLPRATVDAGANRIGAVMRDDKKRKPEPIADVLAGWIDKSGHRQTDWSGRMSFPNGRIWLGRRSRP